MEFDDITAIIGRNDAGKSSVLDALAIFFDDSVKPDCDDATVGGTSTNVRIGCEFDDLPHSIVVDKQFPTNLRDEYLLNEQGRLEVHKVYDCSLARPKQVGVLARAMHPSAKGRSDLLTLKIIDLKKRAEELKVDLSKVNKTVSAEIRHAIWAGEANLQTAMSEIPLDEESAKQIWEQLKRELPIFALFKSDRTSTDQDEEAQDPMKAAVGEALKAKETELKQIEDHVKNEVK